MKRLSELQYFSRMGVGNEPADVTPGDMYDDDIFGNDTGYDEPADVTPGDMNDREYMTDVYVTDGTEVPPVNGYETDPFYEPADVTPGDYGDENIPVFEARYASRSKKSFKEAKYGVYRKGGSIGDKSDGPIEVFDTAEEAKAYAARRRKGLSAGERKYYGMGYITKPIKESKDAADGNVDSIDYKGYTITVHQNRGGKYTAKNDSGEPYSNVRQFNTPEEAIAWDKKNIDQMEEGISKRGNRRVESTVDPRELIDPESELYLGDEDDRIMPELDSIGNIRNDDNEYVQIERSMGRDTADFMRQYNNSPKQRMHKYLFDTHEWGADDDQSDWDDQIEYFYGDLHDNFGDDEDWDDDIARDVASSHMYGHPRWDEKKYGAELKTALTLYETTQQVHELLQRSRMVETTNLPQYGFSNEFIRGIFGNANISHDAEVEPTSKKPSTAMLDDYVILVQAADGGEYAYWRPSRKTGNKSYVMILRTKDGETRLVHPDDIETGKKIINGKYFLIPIEGWDNRNRMGPKYRHDGTRPGNRKPHVKSNSIFPNDVRPSQVMAHLKKIYLPRLQKKADNLVDRIYGALRYLDTKPDRSRGFLYNMKSAAQEALDYVERINAEIESAFGVAGGRRYYDKGETDGMVQLLRLVHQYNKDRPREDRIEIYGLGDNYLRSDEQAIALLQREPQMRFKVVQGVMRVLDSLEQDVQKVIERGRKKESASLNSEP